MIRGEGFVTLINSNIRPQDPGGGAAQLVAPREREKMDVMNPPEVSVVEPQSAPTRISVLLAGMAKPARVTVCRDSHLSPSVEGTLSPPDLARKLFLVVPAGMHLPVGPVGPVAPCGTISPYNVYAFVMIASV